MPGGLAALCNQFVGKGNSRFYKASHMPLGSFDATSQSCNPNLVPFKTRHHLVARTNVQRLSKGSRKHNPAVLVDTQSDIGHKSPSMTLTQCQSLL
jgi:hypothetical protein